MPKGFAGRSQCVIEHCNSLSRRNRLCDLHSKRKQKHGSPLIKKDGTDYPVIRSRGSGTLNEQGYKVIYINGVRIFEHVWLAEKALGKKLPKGAVVHHMNEQPNDNHTSLNLVVCPNQLYHMLLHKRLRKYHARNR